MVLGYEEGLFDGKMVGCENGCKLGEDEGCEVGKLLG